MADIPAFHAIWYTWVPEQPQQQLLIDGRLFNVRHNCHYAVQQARLYDPSVPIWIDSICIDQDNILEKSAQVAIMGDIYCKALTVLACIGPSDDHSDIIEAAVCKLEERPSQQDPEISDALSYRIWPWDHDDQVWGLNFTMAEFGFGAYFKRVWIVQELFGGRGRTMVLCGQSSFSWDNLTLFYDCLEQHYSECCGVQKMNILIGQQATFRPWKLCSVLEHTTDLLCADPRDRIFGVLNLVEQDHERCPIVPDYSLSPVQLLIDLVLGCHFRTLDEVLVLVEGMRLSVYWPKTWWIITSPRHEKNTLSINSMSKSLMSRVWSRWRTRRRRRAIYY